MPGIDPAILAQIGNNQAYPGSPPSPVNREGGGEPDGDEPDLNSACESCCAMLQEAAAAMDNLQGQAEMAPDMDPATEKMIAEAAAKVAEANDAMTQVMSTLSGGGKMPGGDAAAPPPAPGAPPA